MGTRAYMENLDAETALMLACAIRPGAAVRKEKIENILKAPLDWDRFLDAVCRHSLYPLVCGNLSNIDDPRVPDDVARRLRSESIKNEKSMMRLQAEHIRISRIFSDAGIRHIPLKGPLLACRLFGDAGLRVSVDLDLFVSKEELDQADGILLRSGYIRSELEKHFTPRQRDHLKRNVCHFVFRHGEMGHWLDLHWKLDRYHRLDIDFRSAWERAIQFDIDGEVFNALSDEDEFLHMVFHASKHRWRSLKWLADLAALVDGDSEFDGNRMAELAAQYKVEAQVGHALILLREMMGVEPPGEKAKKLCKGRKSAKLARSAGHFIMRLDRGRAGLSRKIRQTDYMFGVFGTVRFMKREWLVPRGRLFHIAPLPDPLFPLYHLLHFIHIPLHLIGLSRPLGGAITSDRSISDNYPASPQNSAAPSGKELIITDESAPARSSDVVWREIDGAVAIAPIYPDIGDATKGVYSITGSGVDIWMRLDGATPLYRIAAFLAESFDAPADAIEKDVVQFVRDISKRGLIEMEKSSTAMPSAPPNDSERMKKGPAQSQSDSLVQKEMMRAVVERGASFRFQARGGSMRPLIRAGDILTIAPLAGSAPRLGDVAAFEEPGSGRLLVHRVVEVGENGRSFLMRGDCCPAPDGDVPLKNIIGTVARVERNGRQKIIPNAKQRKVIARMSERGILYPGIKLSIMIYGGLLAIGRRFKLRGKE